MRGPYCYQAMSKLTIVKSPKHVVVVIHILPIHIVMLDEYTHSTLVMNLLLPTCRPNVA